MKIVFIGYSKGSLVRVKFVIRQVVPNGRKGEVSKSFDMFCSGHRHIKVTGITSVMVAASMFISCPGVMKGRWALLMVNRVNKQTLSV